MSQIVPETEETSTNFKRDIPNLLAKLPAHYRLLKPGEVIFPGCQMGNPAAGTWELTTPQYFDIPVVDEFTYFAAPNCPPGFKPLYGDVTVQPEALAWFEKRGACWLPVPPSWHHLKLKKFWHRSPREDGKLYKYNASLANLLSTNPLICNPTELTWRTKPVPKNHRELFPIDRVREGDKRIVAGDIEWMPTPVSFYGTEVIGDVRESARFARPIPSSWHNWYIDGRRNRGNNKNDATAVHRPCASVKAVLEKLKELEVRTGRQSYGIIWDIKDGAAAMVLDAPLGHIKMDERLLAGSQYDEGEHSVTWILQRMAAMKQHISQATLYAASTTDMPAYHRDVTAAELSQENDLIFSLAPGGRLPLLWQQIPDRLWNKPGGRQYIFARHLEAPGLADPIEIRVTSMESRITSLEAVVDRLAQVFGPAGIAYIEKFSPKVPPSVTAPHEPQESPAEPEFPAD